MANRAYLYFLPETESIRRIPAWEEKYLDSRHNVPLAWLLFFGPDDLILLPHEGGYEEILLAVNWDLARERFARRAFLLTQFFDSDVLEPLKADFLAALERLQKLNLVLDPDEIGIDWPEQWREMLRVLGDESPTQTLETLTQFCGISPNLNPERWPLDLQIFGAWYQ